MQELLTSHSKVTGAIVSSSDAAALLVDDVDALLRFFLSFASEITPLAANTVATTGTVACGTAMAVAPRANPSMIACKTGNYGY